MDEAVLDDLDGAGTFRIPTDDAAVVRRVKALVTTRPLHDLERNKEHYDGEFWGRYDLVSLAVSLIDQVALSMGISAGIVFDDAVAHLCEQAARQHPGADEGEYRQVAEKILAGLVVEDPHEYVYSAPGEDGPVRRRHGFRVLYEQWNANDTIHLRATEEAINVLVNALDLDIESAQIAAEYQIRALVERGALDSAVAVARNERYRSVQYLERIRTIVRDTLIDPDAFDWIDEVPKLLEDAFNHVCGRIEAEAALIEAVEDSRQAAGEPGLRRSANQLVELLKDCRRRHTDLQRHLLDARSGLRRAQDERLAHPNVTLRRANLETDLIQPLLEAPAAVVADWSADLFSRLAGPSQPYLTSGAVLLDDLLKPPPAPSEGEELLTPEFDDDPPEPWWVRYWELADSLVDGIGEATRLSTVLARARDAAQAAPEEDHIDSEVLAAVVAHAAHERLGTPLAGQEVAKAVVVAVPTGPGLSDPTVDGRDLLLVPGLLDPDAVKAAGGRRPGRTPAGVAGMAGGSAEGEGGVTG